VAVNGEAGNIQRALHGDMKAMANTGIFLDLFY
jgi:hypothetical protein